MKAISTLALAGAALFATTPQAEAGKTEKAILGGLIGGIIIGAAISDDDRHHHSRVVVSHGHDCGYYDWVSVKTWVPGYYETGCDRFGRNYRTWVAGHFTFRKEKVWVDGCHSGCGHRHGHYSFQYKSYDHDRYDRDPRRDRDHGDRYDRDDRRGDDRRDGGSHRRNPHERPSGFAARN